MVSRLLAAPLAVLALLAVAACDNVDLTKAIAITDVSSGWYDAGILDGKNHLTPSITFRLKNVSAAELPSAQVSASFWVEGGDGEKDGSPQLRGIGSEGLAPGKSTDPITIRVDHGYTLEQARADLFTHGGFKDFTAKIFVRRSNKIFKMGEFKIDRKILPHESTPAK